MHRKTGMPIITNNKINYVNNIMKLNPNFISCTAETPKIMFIN